MRVVISYDINYSQQIHQQVSLMQTIYHRSVCIISHVCMYYITGLYVLYHRSVCIIRRFRNVYLLLSCSICMQTSFDVLDSLFIYIYRNVFVCGGGGVHTQGNENKLSLICLFQVFRLLILLQSRLEYNNTMSYNAIQTCSYVIYYHTYTYWCKDHNKYKHVIILFCYILCYIRYGVIYSLLNEITSKLFILYVCVCI